LCVHIFLCLDFSLFISGVSMIPSVLQPNVSITASVGGSVMLECHTTADLVVAWFWLKQIPGQKLNPIVSTYYQEIKLQEEFLNESRIQFKVDDKKSALIFTKINSRDAAYYHCGVLLYEKLYFGGGTYLTVNDAKPVKIIQHPVLDSHHVGDSVNLHCSIFGESCSGGQSVYWLRRESHSGIIYTDGDRKDQCETISVTGSTVQSCVHKVPKSLASDETYFCSVVTCGKLIVGNGTKLIADGKACFIKTMAYIITLLSAVLVISVMANIIMVLLWRRTTHRGTFLFNLKNYIV
uniref:Ig-like domain-containing protein n=1 Tax=Sinocyclocheilus anshuiensis TaxID=1608454 RepID=A0A671MZP5_9TELE